MKLVIASDHAGRHLKKTICLHLESRLLGFTDLGVPDDMEKADYPDYARPAAEAIVNGEYDLGILVCGTGTGMAMAANRVHGARAASCTNEFMVKMARAHNDANILTLGERVIGDGLALDLVDIFLATPFEGGRHQNRLDKF